MSRCGPCQEFEHSGAIGEFVAGEQCDQVCITERLLWQLVTEDSLEAWSQ